jgi:hypothetical protein
MPTIGLSENESPAARLYVLLFSRVGPPTKVAPVSVAWRGADGSHCMSLCTVPLHSPLCSTRISKTDEMHMDLDLEREVMT